VFGRYAFLGREGVGEVVKVGDEVRVSRKSEEHTITGESRKESLRFDVMLTVVVIDWPGLTN
jgi:NADPH:quinone reductase-like Zn-dependent oxidoreductase